ncbi:MAG: DUF1223 domain-containing protein [Pseudomonadota bacterium]
MKRTLHLLAVLASVFTAPAAWAQGNAVVVELFTSQGCSSCPPADELLGELSAQTDVVALSLHVDYWDYLGWRDRFARPEFSARQQAYARAQNARSVYTPQMMIMGRHAVVGHRRGEVAARIAQHRLMDPPADITLAAADGTVSVEVTPNGELGETVIFMVTYDRPQMVDIRRGENAGAQITYHNVAIDWVRLGNWSGREPMTFSAPWPQMGRGIAILLQEGDVGPIIAAARLDLR